MKLGEVIKDLNSTDNVNARLDLLEELYWAEYEEDVSVAELDGLSEILLLSETLEEYFAIQRLYSNPEGAMLDFYQDQILKLYSKDPLKFIKASTEYPEDGLNVLYIFRNKGYFSDYLIEKNKLISLSDSDDTTDRIELFFRMYDNLCHT